MKKVLLSLLIFLSRFQKVWGGIKVGVGQNSTAYLWRLSGAKGAQFLLGSNCMVMTTIVLERAEAVVEIGDRTFIGGGGLFSIASKVVIGSDVMIAWGCTITDHDSHSLSFKHRATDVADYLKGRKGWSDVPIGAVSIKNKAWIGFNCSILKGVTIGEGSVVAANSNVTKSVPPWTLVAGNPARIIRELSRE